MLRVEVVLPRDKWEDLLDSLASWGKFEPEPYSEEPSPLGETEEALRAKARKVLSMISDVENATHEVKPVYRGGDLLPDDLSKVHSDVMKVSAQLEELRQELGMLQDYSQMIDILEGVEVPEGYSKLPLVFLRTETTARTLLKELLSGKEVSFKEYNIRNNTLVVLVYPQELEQEVLKTVEENAFTVLRPPKGYSDLSEVQEALNRRLPSEIEGVVKELREIVDTNRDLLSSQKALALNTLEMLKVKTYMASTKYMTLLRGWIPEEDLQTFVDIVRGVDPDAVVVYKKPSRDEYEEVPVLLKNPPPFSWFQEFLKFYSLPAYGTVDPSWLISLFFPVYFGFMLGDAGYGFLGFLIFLALASSVKNESLRNVAKAYMLCSAFAVLFGLVYGEIFGDWAMKLGIVKPLFHRVHNAIDFLLMALGFGVFQVLLGLILGVYNNWVLKHYDHMVMELGRFLALLGLVLWVLPQLPSLGIEGELIKWPFETSALGAVLLVVGLFISVLNGLFSHHRSVGNFFIGVIFAIAEFLGGFGNVVSYARLAAIGLLSAILAEVANMFALMTPVPILSVLIGVLMHALAFVLGIMDPTIQGMRLQFAEFFTKFFKPAGRVFSPFTKVGT